MHCCTSACRNPQQETDRPAGATFSLPEFYHLTGSFRADTRSINLFLYIMIPIDDDGKVAVERAKLKSMSDFLVVPNGESMQVARLSKIYQ